VDTKFKAVISGDKRREESFHAYGVIARLIALTILKNVFSIQEISQTLHLLLQTNSSETLYNHFVDCMRNEENEKTPDIIRYACQSVKLYYKTRQLTVELERKYHES
ncbi:DUF1836 domain-containing protein, partial [Streptococcus suis]|nr:DUF1836 domain-containing protein [Streptococcus suis]